MHRDHKQKKRSSKLLVRELPLVTSYLGGLMSLWNLNLGFLFITESALALTDSVSLIKIN